MGLIKSVKEKFLLLRNVKDNLKLGQVFLLPYPGHHFNSLTPSSVPSTRTPSR